MYILYDGTAIHARGLFIKCYTREELRIHQGSDASRVFYFMPDKKEANNPNTTWLSHDEVFSKIREKHGYEV